MTKLEFMKELESLLSDIPLEERDEALQYYNGYFDDAGENQEQEIIKELGSPKRVASIIKSDLNSNIQDRESRGYFTEKGYQDTSINEEKFELIGSDKKNTGNQQSDNTYKNNTYNSNTNSNSTNNSNSNYNYNNAGQNNAFNAQKAVKESSRNSNIALIVILCFFGWPFILSFFGIVIGILAAIVGVIIGFGAAGIAMIIAGIALVAAGLFQISVPLMCLLFCGSGLLVLGLGMLFAIACIALCKSVLPAMIKGIVNLCRRPFQNRSVAA